MIEHEVREHQKYCEILIKGRIDSITSQETSNEIDDIIDSGARKIAANLDGVNYISSAGLRVFLTTQNTLKKAGGELVFWGLKPQINDIFKMSGFDKIFNIYIDEKDYLKQSGENDEIVETKQESIGSTHFSILKTDAAKGTFKSIGDQVKVSGSSFSEEDLNVIDASDLRFGTGLAAIGQNWDDIKNYFGESIIINGSLFTYPALKLPAVDFMLYNNSGLELKYNFLHGFGFNGDFKYIINADCTEEYSDFNKILGDIVTLTELKTFGLVFICESKGFWGMNLRNIPISDNKPNNNESIFSDKNFTEWMNFPVEPSDINDIIIGAGVYSKESNHSAIEKVLSKESDFHIHSAIFEKTLFDMKPENFENELKRIISEAEVKKVQHLIGKTTFNRAIFGIIEL